MRIRWQEIRLKIPTKIYKPTKTNIKRQSKRINLNRMYVVMLS